jgi:predicted N-formylglutamate amidohydrolase
MTARIRTVISCEHGGNSVPAPYAALFASAEARDALNSHRGWDPGSLELGETLARGLEAPCVATLVTRLLIEPNRSADHPQLFSPWSRGLPPADRNALLQDWYLPHRQRVSELAEEGIACGDTVVHVSVHTFIPVWNGRPRTTDIGLLFDHRRPGERDVATLWRKQLRRQSPSLAVHFNRPYRGWTDGLTTALRRRFSCPGYCGIELEVNQRFTQSDRASWRGLCQNVASALRDALQSLAAETAMS